MQTRPITGNPSQIMIEQLAALGVSYVFNNSGSREAVFFDALHAHQDVHGILALHEGSVTAMAAGYTQVNLDPAVMVVHLGAGLAQCLGQLINVARDSLPVVVITFAGDTGSYGDAMGLDLNHSFGPTSISAPFTKASWTVIEPDGLPQAIDRALRVAVTPPVGPVHLAVYDQLLSDDQSSATIIEGGIAAPRSGYPADSDVEKLAQGLRDAQRPLLYLGDGVWKSGASAEVIAVAEHFGVPVAGDPRSVPIKHRLHCGPLNEATASVNPDYVFYIGVRHRSLGLPEDISPIPGAQRVSAVGPDVANLKNVPGLDLADERRTLQRLASVALEDSEASRFKERLVWAEAQASSLRARRIKAAQDIAPQPSTVRPWNLIDALDNALERMGGGHIVIEQFALPLDAIDGSGDAGNNVYLSPAGGSEGYGVGATVGAKLAAPDRPVVGLVGDGSLYYADSGLWTTVHHGIPVLYVIPNNQAYGIVAENFGRAEGTMNRTGDYAGVVLDRIEPVTIAEGFGVEGEQVQDETRLSEAVDRGLRVVEEEHRPYLLDVRLPLGLPKGGKAAAPFHLANAMARPGPAAD